MAQDRKQREETDDIRQAMDGTAGDYSGDGLRSPMMFGLWVMGLLGIGAAAFVLSALVSAH